MFEILFQKILKADTITIFGHINPDGDCFGSEIALRDSLKLAFPNKHIYALGSGLTNFFDLIGKPDIIDGEIIKHSLAILLDGTCLARMEDKRIFNAASFIKIDHHVEAEAYNEGPYYVDEKASSTCELIYKFIEENDLPINANIATSLMLGIITDTGKFSFLDNPTPVFEICKKLSEKGAKCREINKVLSMVDEDNLLLRRLYLTNYHKTKNGVVYATISNVEAKQCHLPIYRIASSLNIIGNIKGFPIWCSFVEDNDGTLKGEIRSLNADVVCVAKKYGGGGHLQACGFTLPEYNKTNIQNVLNDLDEIAKKEVK